MKSSWLLPTSDTGATSTCQGRLAGKVEIYSLNCFQHLIDHSLKEAEVFGSVSTPEGIEKRAERQKACWHIPLSVTKLWLRMWSPTIHDTKFCLCIFHGHNCTQKELLSWKFLERKGVNMEEDKIHDLKVLGRSPEKLTLQRKARNGSSQVFF